MTTDHAKQAAERLVRCAPPDASHVGIYADMDEMAADAVVLARAYFAIDAATAELREDNAKLQSRIRLMGHYMNCIANTQVFIKGDGTSEIEKFAATPEGAALLVEATQELANESEAELRLEIHKLNGCVGHLEATVVELRADCEAREQHRRDCARPTLSSAPHLSTEGNASMREGYCRSCGVHWSEHQGIVLTCARVSRLERELRDAAEILQKTLAIGKVKHIGLLEVAAGVKELAKQCRKKTRS